MRLQKKSRAIDEEQGIDSIALPRFSFESEDQDRRPLVSTERLFERLSAIGTGYRSDIHSLHDEHDGDIEEIVVRQAHALSAIPS